MQNVSENVKKTVQDAAYIAVGVGVLGAQQAQDAPPVPRRSSKRPLRTRVRSSKHV